MSKADPFVVHVGIPGGTSTYLSDGTRTHYPGSPQATLYVTEAGGVTKCSVLVMAGRELQRLEGVLLDGPGASWRYGGRWVIFPGRMWCKTVWSGNPHDYWAAKINQRPIPDGMGEKLAEPILVPQIGPYSPMWDPSGYAAGGGGIAYNWDWRLRHPAGVHRTFVEAEYTAHRSPCYVTDQGEPAVLDDPEFALKPGFDIPPGWNYDIDLATQHWKDAKKIAQYQFIDGQHLHRMYRAAVALKDIDPMCADLASFYVGYVNGKWAWAASRDGMPPYHWGVKQIHNDLEKTPGPHPLLGREFAHVAMLYHLFGVETEDLKSILEMASDPDTGVPYLTTVPHEIGHHYDLFPPGTPLAQTFQWSLLFEVMCELGMDRERRTFKRYFPAKSRWVADIDGNFVGDWVPYMHLMRGEPSGQVVDYWLDLARSRGIDGGSNPLNYMKPELWEGEI